VLDDSSRVFRRPRRGWPTTARTASAIIGLVSLTLLAAACGGRPPSTGGSSGSANTKVSQVLAFARCMRSHGVTDFPDPNGSGALPKRQVAIAGNNPQFVGAHRACGHLLPNSGQPTQAQVQQAFNDMRNFAQCMRSHGVPDWPDPTVTSPQDNRPFFNTPASVDPNAPQIATKISACQHLLHANDPLDTTQ
jgi:hypothetical protein